ncbi:MAG TPA: TetR/AcrR family transcriptional regulator [Acidimicrobiia bacterium]
MTLQPSDDGVKRPYHSPRREEQAKATKRAIIDAALELFMTNGYQETPVKDVAERAAVSEQTVYNSFGDKLGLLLSAAMVYMDPDEDNPETELLDALRAESDPIERIRMTARSSRETWEGGALQLETMVFGTDARDPRLVELEEKGFAYKYQNTREVCEILFPDEIRQAGLSLDDIAAFATAVDSAATVATLLKLGWTMNKWEEWIAELLVLFLDPAVKPALPKLEPAETAT